MDNEIPATIPTSAAPELASLGSRLAGQIIDGVVMLAMFLAGVLVADHVQWLSAVAIWAGLGYYFLCDGMPGGQSLGKRVMHTACIDSDSGRPCGYGRSAVRNLTQVLGILDWLWIFGRRRRRAGDILAHTSVIKAS